MIGRARIITVATRSDGLEPALLSQVLDMGHWSSTTSMNFDRSSGSSSSASNSNHSSHNCLLPTTLHVIWAVRLYHAWAYLARCQKYVVPPISYHSFHVKQIFPISHPPPKPSVPLPQPQQPRRGAPGGRLQSASRRHGAPAPAFWPQRRPIPPGSSCSPR